jgi:hypothetical protein
MMRRLMLISLLMVTPSILFAQRMGMSHFSGRSGFRAAGFGRSGYGRSGYSALPLFNPLYSDLYSEYPAGDVAPQPGVIVLQPAPAAAAPEPSSRSSQPLMIELQGNHYVQVSGDESWSSQTIDRMPAQLAVRPATLETSRQSTVLVFRDGHREEVSEYTIADGTLYASADYYSSGAWNQKFSLSSLNLPETLTANHARRVPFRLPSAANEVIVGP